ncbi:MAG: DNA-processing protein DprA [Cyanobacteria bacterium P01_H01_bin.74]
MQRFPQNTDATAFLDASAMDLSNFSLTNPETGELVIQRITPMMPDASTAVINRDHTAASILYTLRYVHKLSLRCIHRLLKAFKTPQALWYAPLKSISPLLTEQQLSNFKLAREAEKGVNAVLGPTTKKIKDPCQDWLHPYNEQKIQVIPCSSPLYPAMLRHLYNAPVLLFVKGNTNALTNRQAVTQSLAFTDDRVSENGRGIKNNETTSHNPESKNALAVVGNRACSQYGLDATRSIIEGLKNYQPSIISGLAAGIDTQAHQTAIENNMQTVAVFGCGLDTIYPTSNRKLAEMIVETAGALVSEYPLGTEPDRFRFPERNRIVAGLSEGVLVVEGTLQSGSLITAKLALEEGRAVFAVPGPVFSKNSQGPIKLIKQGAIPVTSGKDIADDLGWHQKTTALSKRALSQSDKCSAAGSISEASATHMLSLKSVSESTVEDLYLHSQTAQVPVPEQLSDEQKLLFQKISDSPVSIEDLTEQLGWANTKVLQELTFLELEGCLSIKAGAMVCRL